MTAWPHVYDAPVSVNETIANAAETPAVTLMSVTTPGPGARVVLTGWLTLTPGAGTTGVTLRIRRGAAVTDPLVEDFVTVNEGVAAGVTGELSISVTDTPPEVAGQPYVLTVQQAGGTATGTVINAMLTATVE